MRTLVRSPRRSMAMTAPSRKIHPTSRHGRSVGIDAPCSTLDRGLASVFMSVPRFQSVPVGGTAVYGGILRLACNEPSPDTGGPGRRGGPPHGWGGSGDGADY